MLCLEGIKTGYLTSENCQLLDVSPAALTVPTVSLLFVPNKLTPFRNAPESGNSLPTGTQPASTISFISFLGPVKSGKEELRVRRCRQGCFFSRQVLHFRADPSAGAILSPKVAGGSLNTFLLKFSVLCPSVFPQVHALTRCALRWIPFPRTSLPLDHKLCDGQRPATFTLAHPMMLYCVLHIVHAPYLCVKWKLASVC